MPHPKVYYRLIMHALGQSTTALRQAKTVRRRVASNGEMLRGSVPHVSPRAGPARSSQRRRALLEGEGGARWTDLPTLPVGWHNDSVRAPMAVLALPVAGGYQCSGVENAGVE